MAAGRRSRLTQQLDSLKKWAGALKRDIMALWIAARSNRTPWSARVVAAIVSAYALSPIDLIPDFIPVFGYLDDIIIVPLGIALVIYLIPAELMADFRAQAMERQLRPRSYVAAAVVFIVWVAAAIALGYWIFPEAF